MADIKENNEVLVVEDSRAQADQLKYMLEKHGYCVSVAGSGLEALALAAQHKPTVVISDTMMAEMDGYELCQHLKAEESLKDVPVILATAFSDSRDIIRGLECGADNFITKPYQENFLLSRIQYVLATRESQHDNNGRMVLEVSFSDRKYRIASSRWKMLNLLLSTYEVALQKNMELTRAQDELRRLNEHLEAKVREKTADLVAQIAEFKRVDEALRASERKLRVMFDSVNEGIVVMTLDGTINQANDALVRMSGSGCRETLIGKDAFAFIATKDLARMIQNLKKTVELGSSKGFEFTFVCRDGRVFPAEFSAAVIRDAEENPAAFVAVIEDITERKKMQEQLILTDRLASIGELASGIAHELNNPLTSVIGFSQLLMARDIPGDIKEDIEIIHREAQRTANVVKNLLTFARKHAPAKQAVDVHRTIEKVLELRTYQQKVSNILIIKNFGALPEIMADFFQLQQVFLNIIINAEYFMIEAHGKGTLTISTERVGDKMVSISFADDGPGIPAENLKYVFTPFFTTKPVGKGTGLGLSICHGIVTAHGGNMRVESQPGKGTTFTVELPVEKQPKDEVNAEAGVG